MHPVTNFSKQTLYGLEFDWKFMSLSFCRQMDEKDKELDQVRKKLESLHCQCDDYTRKIEDMEADLTHVQQEILALRIECEHKDKQVCPFYNASLLKDC